MALRINTNIGAMTAHRFLNQTDNLLSKSVEKLSSGYRINVAADDPSGLVISEGLRANASGLGVALGNTQHAINMIKTAEAAMADINSLLRTMRDLAVHAANTGVNDADAIAAVTSEAETSSTSDCTVTMPPFVPISKSTISPTLGGGTGWGGRRSGIPRTTGRSCRRATTSLRSTWPPALRQPQRRSSVSDEVGGSRPDFAWGRAAE